MGSMLWLLQISPGYNAFLLVTFGACVAEPFDTTRWFITRQLRTTGMIPFDVEGIYNYEVGNTPWRSDALIRLAIFGAVVRAIVLILFMLQSHFSFVGFFAVVKTRIRDCFKRCAKGKRSAKTLLSEMESVMERRRPLDQTGSTTDMTPDVDHEEPVAAPVLSARTSPMKKAATQSGSSSEPSNEVADSSASSVDAQRKWLANMEDDAAISQRDDELSHECRQRPSTYECVSRSQSLFL